METAPPEVTLISPDGLTVRTSDLFECPNEIIIGRSGVSFNGWVFRTDHAYIMKSDLAWLCLQLKIISETQSSERALALCEAVEKQVNLAIETQDHEEPASPPRSQNDDVQRTPSQMRNQSNPAEPETGPPEITLISPDGLTVRTSDFFECPNEIIIGRNGVSFNGWVFRPDRGMIGKSDLSWLSHQLALISDTQGKDRAEAVCDALEQMIANPSESADGTDYKNSTSGGSRRS